MKASYLFFMRLEQRYGVSATQSDVVQWHIDIYRGRAELVWVNLRAESATFRLLHRETGIHFFGVHVKHPVDMFITALEPYSLVRTQDGWRQPDSLERARLQVPLLTQARLSHEFDPQIPPSLPADPVVREAYPG